MTLSTDTKITIGTAIAVVSTSIAATWWFSQQLAHFRSELATLASRISQGEAEVAKSYTLAAASEQALRMALENPGLRVPDPRNPSQLITARRSNDAITK
ncbi:MAG: hypothetical protein IPK69_11820 [Phycisphaerales bacterium]|nr:MAG: hypothetical protein IPK69_11820 [Phycisphaerales bacterium]